MALTLSILLFFVAIQLLCAWAIHKKSPESSYPSDTLPQVSILLAARNEEKLILRSLRSIEALDYPKDKLQIIIGNDQSTDNTRSLILEFIEFKHNYKLIDVDSNLGKGRGKANVLAHLAHQATGEIFFVTDVDVQLPNQWIRTMLAQFEDGVGIVSGTTTCESGVDWFSRMQSIDWLHFMGYIQSFANIGVSCTAVGNNMAVRAEAYWQVGGYENIEFSITEDYKLFVEVTKVGWHWRTILNPGSLGLATYLSSFKEMLHQRKRWLIGAKELPVNWKILLVLYGLFLPALFYLLYLLPLVGLSLWLAKFGIQSIYIQTLAAKTALKPFVLKDLLMYEAYVLCNTFITAIFYFMPVKAIWKGRTYSNHDLK